MSDLVAYFEPESPSRGSYGLGVLYRYQERSQLTTIIRDEYLYDVNLELHTYTITKRTPKGVWIDRGWHDAKFVNLTCRKKFANPTKREALEAYLARKIKHIEILIRQTSVLKLGMEEARKLLGEMQGDVK